MTKCGLVLAYAVPEIRADKEVVLMAVSRDGRALQFAAVELRDDREVVMKAVGHHGRAIEFASERLRGDLELAAMACTNEGRRGKGLRRLFCGSLKGDRLEIDVTIIILESIDII